MVPDSRPYTTPGTMKSVKTMKTIEPEQRGLGEVAPSSLRQGESGSTAATTMTAAVRTSATIAATSARRSRGVDSAVTSASSRPPSCCSTGTPWRTSRGSRTLSMRKPASAARRIAETML